MKTFLRGICIVLILYLFFFEPNFSFVSGLSSIYLVYALVFAGVLAGLVKFKKITSCFKRELLLLSLLLLYTLFRTLIGGAREFLSHQIMAILNVYFVPLCIVSYLRSIDISHEQTVRYVLISGSVASLLTCLCFAIPSMDTYVRFSLMEQTEDMYVQTHLNRGFGVAGFLTSGYGSALALIACYGVFYGKDNKWFYLLIPFMVIAMLINARTSFIVLALGILLYLFVERRVRSIFTIAIVGGLFLLLAQLAITKLVDSELTINWVLSFFDELSTMMSGDSMDDTTAGVLFGSQLVWPHGIFEWLFGAGANIFDYQPGVGRSDIGFIRQLYYGGVIFLGLIISFVGLICKKAKGAVFKGFVPLVIISALIFHTKGIFVTYSIGFRVLVFMYYSGFYSYVCRKRSTR